jgi:hypothetical protein
VDPQLLDPEATSITSSKDTSQQSRSKRFHGSLHRLEQSDEEDESSRGEPGAFKVNGDATDEAHLRQPQLHTPDAEIYDSGLEIRYVSLASCVLTLLNCAYSLASPTSDVENVVEGQSNARLSSFTIDAENTPVNTSKQMILWVKLGEVR